MERVFERYGRLVEVWQSRTVPAFAFVVFKKDEDAADAHKSTDGMYAFYKIPFQQYIFRTVPNNGSS